VKTIAGSAFLNSGVTLVSCPDFTMHDSLLTHLSTIVRCFGESAKVIIMRLTESEVRVLVRAIGCKRSNFRSLSLISESAFNRCQDLQKATFAAGSKLQAIRAEAFWWCDELRIVLPGSFSEIDPSAFGTSAWQNMAFNGRSPFLNDAAFVRALAPFLIRE
jgi:hypothetical protein